MLANDVPHACPHMGARMIEGQLSSDRAMNEFRDQHALRRWAGQGRRESPESTLVEGGPTKPLESTAALLEQVRAGNAGARERLVARCLPALKRWARGRLPDQARGMVDTDDLVQISLLRALNRIDSFQSRGEGAFLAYLRQILLNSIRDELRRAARHPAGEDLPETVADDTPSLVEQAIGREALERYESALATLPEGQQEAVILRVELGYSYQQVADAIGSPSANAARMTVARALLHLAETMNERG
jgi:RNA polymerase sigma factor (sigma-70 family)